MATTGTKRKPARAKMKKPAKSSTARRTTATKRSTRKR